MRWAEVSRVSWRMSGEQFLVELRRRQLQLPIVLLTGQMSGEAGGDGVSAVLLKPPGSGELVRTIRSVLDRARSLQPTGDA